jgi:hypothetical protein
MSNEEQRDTPSAAYLQPSLVDYRPYGQNAEIGVMYGLPIRPEPGNHATTICENTGGDTQMSALTLYRPVGGGKLALIMSSGWGHFRPSLPPALIELKYVPSP